MATGNIILDEAGQNITIQTTKVEVIRSNQIIPISVPTNTDVTQTEVNNVVVRVPPTLIVDLVTITLRINVNGTLNSLADRDKMRILMDTNGVFTMKYDINGDGTLETFNVCFEKYIITEIARDNSPVLDIMFTVIVGEDYRSA